MTKEHIRTEMEAGSNDAVEKARIPGLTSDELEHILEIITDPSKIVSVERGKEIVLTEVSPSTLVAPATPELHYRKNRPSWSEEER